MSEQDDIDLAVWWAMSRPGVFLDSVGDVDLLPKVLDAASRFAGAPDDAAMSGADRPDGGRAAVRLTGVALVTAPALVAAIARLGPMRYAGVRR